MSKLEVIYEDEDILAVNKPAGLSVHSDGRMKEETLVDWILKTHPEMRDVGEPLDFARGKTFTQSASGRFTSSIVERPGIVHRLDKETSGILVLAKNQDAFLFLKRQFQERRVEKTYNAFLHGELKEKEGVIDSPIGKSKRDFRRRAIGASASGVLREAITEYKVLKSAKEYTYAEAYPKTGRMHQIRIHFKSIGHPVVCDKLYAPKRLCLLGFKRLALHARVLSIEVPSGKRLILEAPLPSDFERALGQF